MNLDIQKIIKAAKAGGEVLKKYYGKSLETIQKTTVSDFKTKADIESEDAILSLLVVDFPDYNIHSEERGEINKNSEYTFVIDPLDGTNNFVLGIPNFSVSIGLLHKDEIIAGVIYTPIIDNTYYAQKDRGAFCDGQKLQVSKELKIKKATICNNCSYETYFTEEVKVMSGIYSKGTKRLMFNWSPAFDFCMLAIGRVEGIINNGCELYDFAAGKLIAKEAGAMITDFDGKLQANDRAAFFVASNGTNIHKHLIEIMGNKRS